jgi:diguanylate cyclase (GGDEF)-like protein
MLATVAPEADDADSVAFRRQLHAYRATIADTARRAELPLVIEACADTCEAYFQAARRYQRAREDEFKDIIAILREAASIALGDASEFHLRMLESSERFGQLAELDDMRDLKSQLLAEVGALRATVEEKQRRDERAYTALNQRVEALQSRLTQVEAEAALDPLTRVANRHGFQRTLTRMVEQARSRNMPLALAMIDVDNFKAINDTHGHPIGDRVLLCTAQWLTRGLRQTDYVARYGGEEFAILLGSSTAAQVEDRLRQLLAAIAGSSYEYELLGQVERVNFTVSCGLTELIAGDTEESLVQRADDALYEAKRKGKNRVAVRRRSSLKTLLSWG